MKILKSTLVLFAIVSMTTATQAQAETQKVKEDTIDVAGVCMMCKKRIEDAAYSVKGVKFAEWHKTTKTLALAYRTDKTSLEEIGNSLAKTGHKNSVASANEEDYSKLPDCCKYEQVHDH